MSRDGLSIKARIDRVHGRIDIAAVIGRAVKLGRGAKPRGKCPFHGSKSDSLSVDADAGRARCWGCGWSGDAIGFVQDHYGLTFLEALARLEEENGLDGLSAAPARRQKRERRQAEQPAVDSAVMGRFIWKHARPDPDAIATYLRARGVAPRWLTAERLCDIRFHPQAPIMAWAQDGVPGDVPQAPAMVALVRRPPSVDAPGWTPIGVHVTYLSPGLDAKMERLRRDGTKFPARKMLGGSQGGGVLFPGAGSSADDIDPAARLFVGEGLETVLSGMEIWGADERACALAALSLDNLQGRWRSERGALPLYDPQPDPERPPLLAFPHDGPVVGLVDADMAPLRGTRDRDGRWTGIPVIERRRGPVVRRALTTAERATLCAMLFVRGWRAHGCDATAYRPPMGLDFNDMARETRHG